MNRSRIFISSVQREFSQERERLRAYLREDALMQHFFDVFLFEDVPALDRRPDDLYLDKVEQSDLYVGLFGNDYGSEDENGISPTEREFEQATTSGVHRLIFVKGTNDDRHPKMQELIHKAQSGLVRKRFNTSEELVTELYEALLEYLKSKGLVHSESFDAAPCSKASLDDLDTEQMRWFIRTARSARGFRLAEGASTEKLLIHLNLLNDSKPTNAAMLLFGKSPQQFLISSKVKCAHFHGTEVTKPIPSYQVYTGTAFQLVDQAVDFVLSKIALSVGTRAKSVQAPVAYEIPKEVVTEAIVNAVAHRDYATDDSIQVMIFTDRIEILNPGRLSPSLTLEQLRVPHSSIPNNPLLADALYRTQYIEQMGTGIIDMINRCREADLPEPEFTISGGFKTIIRRATPPAQIMVQSEFPDEYLELVLSLLTNELMSKSKLSKNLGHLKPKIANAFHQYNKNYRERHGQIKVFSVGMRKPIPLDDIYVGVQFLNQHTASQYKSPEEIEQAFRERGKQHFDPVLDERQEGIQVANNEQHLMLLGGPGVGKSTFLRKVGLEALKGKAGNFKHECIPVFLELKRFTEEQIDIEALISKEFEICGYPYPEHLANAALKSGKLLILFDGLDEVPTTNVDNVIRKIGDFVDQYSQNRFIASCRIAAYTGGFIRFTEVEMADFDDSQIHTYIRNWFDSTPDQHRKQLDEEMGTAEQCWKTLNAQEHQATKELARNPLLLTFLCMVYDNSQSLSRDRGTLYEKALNIFLEEWAAEKRVYRSASINQYLDISDEKQMLSEIAAKNFEENRLFLNEYELIAQIQEFGEGSANTPPTFNAFKILETIVVDQGLFVERVSNFYSFSHLVFQEYLTANHIVGYPRSIQSLVNQHLHDERWREVLLLTAGLMRETDDLLIAMETEAAKFINTDRLKSLFRWAKRITDPVDNRYNKFAKRAFAIDQYFFLLRSNKTGEEINRIVKYNTHFYRYLDINLDWFPYIDFYHNSYLHQDLYRDLYPNRSSNPRRDQNPYIYTNDTNLYLDPYQYVDTYFYKLFSTSNRDQFDEELLERITFVERMKQMKIFKKVNLQRMVDRFNLQREFIKAAGKGETIEPPIEPIHDTWLSVLGITNDMLAISDEELESCHWYLRAVELIIACKEAAGRVSPEVWQKIEDKLLAPGT